MDLITGFGTEHGEYIVCRDSFMSLELLHWEARRDTHFALVKRVSCDHVC